MIQGSTDQMVMNCLNPGRLIIDPRSAQDQVLYDLATTSPLLSFLHHLPSQPIAVSRTRAATEGSVPQAYLRRKHMRHEVDLAVKHRTAAAGNNLVGASGGCGVVGRVAVFANILQRMKVSLLKGVSIIKKRAVMKLAQQAQVIKA